MDARLLTVAIERETDIIAARQRTRQIAALLGFDAQDQTRITTAVSEIVRNALDYGGGGRIEYKITGRDPQCLEIVVQDSGPGMADPEAVLSGRHRSTTGMGVGILGARRLMDEFELQSHRGQGTTVRMVKCLPKRAPAIYKDQLKPIMQALATAESGDPVAEIRNQNREMMLQLQELQARQQELAQLNDELQDTNRGVVALYAELEERADHLRRADQLKSRFLSNMSHEFRTPLNSILSLSRLLLGRTDGELTPEQEKQVLFVRKAAESLAELVDNLLDIARVEAGKVVVTSKEFEAGELFSTLRGMLRPLLVGNALNLVFDDPDDIPTLFTDEGKVSQILRNFISNAIKFTERGEVRVWAVYDRETDTVTWNVRDTGVGIAAADLDRIWQEFTQVANRLQGRVKGTGLGLPLSKRLAELLGGEAGVESVVGQGSLFWVRIPRRYCELAGAPDEGSWTVEPGRLPVLILEDDPADAFSLERSLAYSRYQPISVRSVAEAKRALERITPAAFVLDIVLQGEECWRFLIDAKHDERTQDVPAVLVSSTADEQKARSFGADEFMVKPVDPAGLVRWLDEMTGARGMTKVLLVDDEEVSRYVVRQLLPRGAYELREAANAIDGLEQAKADPPDVILLDLNMDMVDGFEFLDRLHNGEGAGAPPAIILTSLVLDEAQKERVAHASGILSKFDLTADRLVGAIREALQPHPPPAP
ncbi:MAG TPA: ATP-binding protein [Alphaproteobacteria bacterium]|nr:ATP-binding protein [Alphaproteobacteria bacterium]